MKNCMVILNGHLRFSNGEERLLQRDDHVLVNYIGRKEKQFVLCATSLSDVL